MIALGKAIRTLRTAKGLSQKELARRAEITPSFLSQVENDQKQASFTLLSRISAAMNVVPEVIIWESLEMPGNLSSDDRRICEIAKSIARRAYENASRAAYD
jgi:transcriptional regulator with XRE-family HTH domain